MVPNININVHEFLVPFKNLFKEWRAKKNFAILLLTGIVAIFLHKFQIEIYVFKIVNWHVAVIVSVISTAWWLLARRPPRNTGNCLGILVAIKSDNSEISFRTKDDFLLKFNEEVSRSKMQKPLNIVRMPEAFLDSIKNHWEANEHIIRSNFHFMLYGRIINRPFGGAEKTFFELNVIVKHALVSNMLSEKLSNECVQILPPKLILPANPDYFHIEISSRWAGITAKYMLAVASYFTGDFKFALQIFEELQSQIAREPDAAVGMGRLKSFLPERINDCCIVLNQISHFNWRKSRASSDLIQAHGYSTKVQGGGSLAYGRLMESAIYYFVIEKNVGKAIKATRDARDVASDNAWMLSMAFLLAYQGKLHEAIAKYRAAMKGQLDQRTIIEVEEFLDWTLSVEPDKYSLHFLLGLLNMDFKQDFAAARRDFEGYLSKANETNDSKYISRAKEYLGKIPKPNDSEEQEKGG